MKIGVFNASDNTLAEAIQNDSITWVESRCGLDVMKPLIAASVFACANHDLGFIDGDLVEYMRSKDKPKQPEYFPYGATHIHCGLYYKRDIDPMGMSYHWQLYTKKDGWILTPMVDNVSKHLKELRQDNAIPEGATHTCKGVYYKLLTSKHPKQVPWHMWHRGEWRPTLVMSYLELVPIDQ